MLGRLRATNEITNKMTEQTQVNAPNVKVPLQLTTKYPKKVAQGYRLVEYNRSRKEKLAQVAKAQPDEAQNSESHLSYGVEAGIAVGVLGLLGYYIYQRGIPGDNNNAKVTPVETRTNKFEME